jgi:surface protein
MRNFFFFLVLVLFLVNENKAQSNPDVDCPAPETYFVGEYQVVDVNASIVPSNGSENFQSGIFTVTGNGNTRTFQNQLLPQVAGAQVNIDLLLNCGTILFNEVSTGLTCSGPSILYSPQDDANSTPYDLNDDSSFVINYIEDPLNSCGGPYNSSFSMTKVCSKPQNVSFINATISSVDMSWLDTNNTSTLANTYTIEYGNQGFTLGSGQTLTGITGNSNTINNLMTNNPYDFYIRGVCSDGTFSDFVGPFTYTIENIPNNDFVLDANGVTCLCPSANFGDSGTLTVNGELKTFTKRTEQELRDLAIADPQDSQIPLTCTSGITNMASMFDSFFTGVGPFNQSLEHWDVSNVTNMFSMFLGQSSFNQPLNMWDVSNVTNMWQMFGLAESFNQPLNNWDVSSVTTMDRMFLGANSFNQPIDSWNVSNVTNMNAMLNGFGGNHAFNQPLNSWDVSSVINLNSMFAGSDFNQPLDNWDVSNALNLNSIFNNCSDFDQDLSSWVFSPDVNLFGMLDNSGLSTANYESLLQSFDTQNLIDKTLGAANMVYCETQFRDNLINNKNWTITGDFQGQCGDVLNPSTTAFVTTWTVSANDLSIDINTFGAYNYDFDIDWGDGTTNQNVTSKITHTYASSGTYPVTITGVFPYFLLCESQSGSTSCNNSLKLTSIESWGDQEWQSMLGSFNSGVNLVLNDTTPPDLSKVETMDYMFSDCSNLNQPMNNWDVSNVESMSYLFSGASQFNQALSSWNVSSVSNFTGMFNLASNFNQFLETWDMSNALNLSSMFRSAISFDQPLNNWSVSNVTNMSVMFLGATGFDQPLNNWDVSNVTNMDNMFRDAANFNQPLDNWDVSNVTNMRSMFFGAASFDQPLNSWNTSNNEFFNFMFFGATSFNQPLDNWDFSSLSFINNMFEGASAFNQNLNNWDMSGVLSINNMFKDATSFNQPLDSWDTSNIESMEGTFSGATAFNQDISGWCVEQIASEPTDFALNSALQNDFKPNWGATCTLSIENNNLITLSIYPNPASQVLNLQIPNINESINVEVYNLLGQKVKSEQVSLNNNQTQLNVAHLKSGVYLVRIDYNGKAFTEKFIKE